MTMPELGIDFETRSVANLQSVGAYRYAAHPTTEIICAAFAMDDGQVETWTAGERCPDVIERAVAEGWTIHAHNAGFERLIWRHVLAPRHGWPEPRLEQWRCTMATALMNALPGGLEGAAIALELPHRKDQEGRAAMLRLSQPRKPRKGEDPTGVYWDVRDGDLERARRYNVGDVGQERAVRRQVRPLPPAELELWRLDAVINDRGFGVDVELIKAAGEIVAAEKVRTPGADAGCRAWKCRHRNPRLGPQAAPTR
jgi:DNA polymerase